MYVFFFFFFNNRIPRVINFFSLLLPFCMVFFPRFTLGEQLVLSAIRVNTYYESCEDNNDDACCTFHAGCKILGRYVQVWNL